MFDKLRGWFMAKDKQAPPIATVRTKVEEALASINALDPQDDTHSHLAHAVVALEQALRLVDKHIERSRRRADLPE
jgi:hypothetical protein